MVSRMASYVFTPYTIIHALSAKYNKQKIHHPSIPLLLLPALFIGLGKLYEGKMRIKEFLELCMHILDDVDEKAFLTAISKYEEILTFCEKCMNEIFPKTPTTVEEATSQRQAYIGILQRCRGLEEEALSALEPVMAR